MSDTNNLYTEYPYGDEDIPRIDLPQSTDNGHEKE